MGFEPANDQQEIIERVAALDIGKASLVCCVRLPGATARRRVQEVTTYSTMTRYQPVWVGLTFGPR